MPVSFPTLFDARLEHAEEETVDDARIWTHVRRAHGVRIVPDLSRDVLVTARGVQLLPRTVGLEIATTPPGPVAGIRLPLDAVDPRVDETWEGWRRLPADPPSVVLAAALGARAITWRREPWIDRLVGALDTARGVGGAARELAVSERSLHRMSRRSLGIGPRYAGRVLRLWRLVAAVRHSGLAEATATAGFADQAHATRESRALFGLTPREIAGLSLSGSFKIAGGPGRES